MASPRTVATVRSPRQLAEQRERLLREQEQEAQYAHPHRAYRGQSEGYGMSRYPRPRINAKATLAETGSDVIKRQGGLSPSYGPSGINDTYNTGGIPAWNRLQQSMKMAQEGRATDADRIERADQLQGMGLQGGQDLRNRVNANTAALENRDVFAEAAKYNTGAAKTAQSNAVDWENPNAYDPYAGEEDPLDYGKDETVVPGAAKGGNVTGKAVVGEAGPETKFNQDGSIDQFNKPTLLNNAKPGIIVPNPALKQFLQKFNHPPKDAVGIMPAFASGGRTGSDIGSQLGLPQEVIGLSKRGQNSMGGITNAAGTITPPLPMNPNTGAPLQPLKATDMFAPMAILPPSENSAALLPEDEEFNLDGTPKRKQMEFASPVRNFVTAPVPAFAQGGKIPAYAEGGNTGYDMEETRTDEQGNVWARNPNKPDSGIIVKRAPVNQNMRRFLHSWEDPQNSGIVQNVDAYAQGIADKGLGFNEEGGLVERGFDRSVQAPAERTPATIESRYGYGSVSQGTEYPTFINNLPAEEFFQREANRGGHNAFAQPEADSSFLSRPKTKKAPSLAQTNPALFNEFEKWRKGIQQGQL